MKVILTEKITKLGNIGDTVEVKTGFARNYLLPNGKAMRFTRENVALFEAKKAELQARQDAARDAANANVDAIKNAKLHMIRQAGDTGQLYGSVSTRDIARTLTEETGVAVESAQVMLGSPIKSIGAFDTKIALHPDVIVPVRVFVAQTQDEIDALVAGKVLTFGTKKVAEDTDDTENTDNVAIDAEVAENTESDAPAKIESESDEVIADADSAATESAEIAE